MVVLLRVVVCGKLFGGFSEGGLSRDFLPNYFDCTALNTNVIVSNVYR